MAYLDQRAGTNQRAAIGTAVALLQGAAILALVNGLAVHFIPLVDKPPLEARQIDMPLPPPPEPVPEPVRETIRPQPDSPPVPQQQRVETVVGPFGNNRGAIVEFSKGQDLVQIEPPPLPAFKPQAASPNNRPQDWVGQADYPAQELRMEHQGRVGFSLTIGTSGKVEACVVTETSGYPGLDEAACKYITRRARFKPATDGAGNPTIGSYSSNIHWIIPRG